VTDALDADQRTTLERLVTKARRVLEDDLLDRASGRYGIDPDGTIAEESALHLDPTALAQRRELVEVVEHLRSEGDDAPGAVQRLVREATFTHLNRLVAIRIAEALGLLPPTLANGQASQGFRDLLELVPSLADDDTGGYWTYLRLCGDELAGDVPALFDPRNPLLALAPSPRALDDVVELISAPDAADLWLAPDCLGWVYQFFNTTDERRALRQESAAPRNSRELAVRNQFFTPRYVVDFLVQNSLGRRLLDADPTSPLLDELPLLIDPPVGSGEPLELSEVSLLDPACGSGHFLLAGYDLLERAWHHAGIDAATAAPAIVRSLWGIDIDPRCAQVAAAAITFRARRSCPDGPLPRPNVVCARGLPATATGLDDVLEALPDRARQLVRAISDAMADAPELGSLLKIEDRLATEVRAAAFGGAGGAGSLAEELPEETLQSLEDQLLAGLRRVADAATATPAERLLAAEADDAVRFLSALQRRYDAVCMNPPFGEAVPSTKEYLKAAYPWIPTRDYNLLAAFVGRGIELCKPGGYVGAITSRAGLFLKTFEAWREEVLLGNRLVALADLGYGVMEQALVEAAAYVVGADQPEADHRAAFVRLLKDVDRPRGLRDAIAASRRGEHDHRVYEVAVADFEAIPGAPLAYWMGAGIRRLFVDHPGLEGHGGDARQGLASGDDFRFVRAFWEVDPERIARTREETHSGRRWVPFAKGGEYSPYWADIHLLVDWEHDGERIRGYSGARPQNTQYFFRPGLTWPRRTNSGFGIRVLPTGAVFADKGSAVVPAADPGVLLLWLKSRVVQALIDAMVAAGEEVSSGGASRSYEVGLVQRLPWVSALNESVRLRDLAAEIVDLRRKDDTTDETTRSFVAPAVLTPLTAGARFADAVEDNLRERCGRTASILRATLDAEREVHRIVEVDADTLDYLDEEVGRHPATYEAGKIDEARFARLYEAPIDAVIDEVISEKGGSRAIANLTFFADRRLEVLAHAFERPVDQLIALRDKLSLLPPEEPARSATDLLSYLVGVAFGRWDARIGAGRAPAPDLPPPFEPVPLYAPGALAGRDPAVGVPDDGILLDQPGHRWDIEVRIDEVAKYLFGGGADAVLSDAVGALGRRGVRDYLRRAFFRAHLSKYSKSRRKAPIYWPLYVPSGSWGLWVYAPALRRETLFAIARHAAQRLDHAEAEIRRLVRERESGGAGRSDRAVANALAAEESLAEELRRFRDEAERIAGLGWEPDLDDGIILCAAPLADLFPAWRDAAAARRDLKAGKYDWATVARWADQL